MQILRRPAVLARTGLSQTGLYRHLKAGTFPKPIRLTDSPHGRGSVGWDATDVDAWIAQRKGAQQ